jgi:hypothetical protein
MEPQHLSQRTIGPGPTKLVNRHHGDRYDQYIGRGTIWGNPFSIESSGSREAAIGEYRRYLLASPELLAQLEDLRGLTLACSCKPMACHGDVLLELIDSME